MSDQEIKYSDILDTCLDRVLNRQESIAFVLSAYPEQAEVIRPQLEVALLLAITREELAPSPASRQRLVERIKQERSPPIKAVRQSWFNRLADWLVFENRKKLQIGLVLIFLVAFLASTGVALVKAQDALPGDQWYQLKITQEKVALALSLDDANDAQLSVEFTKRRLGEVKRLISDGRYENIDLSVEHYKDQIAQTVRSLDQVANQNAERAQVLATSFKIILSDQNQELHDLVSAVPETTRPRIVRALNISQGGLSAMIRLLEGIPDPPAFEDTATATPTLTSTPTVTNTWITTFTASPTATRTNRPKLTRTSTQTNTITPTSTPTIPRASPTPVPSATDPKPHSPSATPFPTDPPLPTATETPRNTPTPLPTDIPLPSATRTNLPTPTPFIPPTTLPTITLPEPSATEVSLPS